MRSRWRDLHPAELGKIFRIIDVHSHIGDYPAFGVSQTAEELLEEMNRFNIRTSIIFSVDNRGVLNALEQYDVLRGMVWVNPKDEKTVDFLKKSRRIKNFIGVKLHPLLDGYLPNDPVVYPVVELTRDAGWVILIHCGHPPFSLPWSIEELAENFPDQKFILGHMGHGHIVYINAAIQVARRRRNIYLETSGMPMHSKIKEAVSSVGEHRVLWGSDAPFHDIAVELMRLQAADLSESEMRAVLGDNAAKLLNLGL